MDLREYHHHLDNFFAREHKTSTKIHHRTWFCSNSHSLPSVLSSVVRHVILGRPLFIREYIVNTHSGWENKLCYKLYYEGEGGNIAEQKELQQKLCVNST